MSKEASPETGAGPVLAELIETERNYLHEIRTCLEVFIRPLKLLIVRDPIITASELELLECNLESIFGLTKALLFELEKRKKSPGQVIADEAENMRRVYVKFVSIYLDAYSLHSRLYKDWKKRKNASQSYSQFIRDASERQRQRVRMRSLQDFYILPIQRVPRYRLLMIELWKRTPAGLERDWMKEAVLRVSAVATEMNRSLSHATSQKKLLRQQTLKQMEDGKEEKDPDGMAEDEDLFAEEDALMDNLATLTQTLYRTRNPTMFNLDSPQADDIESKDDIVSTREEEMEHLCLTRGWSSRKRLPTHNVFALFQVVTRPDPFADVRVRREVEVEQKSVNHPLNGDAHARGFEFRRMGQNRTRPKAKRSSPSANTKRPSAMQLVARLMKGIYAPTVTPRPFHPRSGDVIVVGPVRSGHTPVLHALECLRSGMVVPVSSLVDRVAWIESDEWDRVAPFSGNGRLIKTHGRLNQAFGGVLQPVPKNGSPDFKVVAILRHPADLRLSLFRHCRRLYRKCAMNDDGEEMMDFDDLASVEDFAGVLPSYEAYVADVLKVALEVESPQLKIVFYEQLVAQPKRIVQQLAEFIGIMQIQPDPLRLIDAVAKAIKSQAEFPLPREPARRYGSMSQGRAQFGRNGLVRMEEAWLGNLSASFPQFASYDALYLSSTQTLLPMTSKLPSSAANGTGGNNNNRSQGSVLTRGASVKTGISSSANSSSFIVMKHISQSVLAPLTRLARSSSMIILGPSSTVPPTSNQSESATTSSTLRRSSLRFSLKSIVNGSPRTDGGGLFTTNGTVKAEGLPRAAQQQQQQRPLHPKSAGRLTHLGIGSTRQLPVDKRGSDLASEFSNASGEPMTTAQMYSARRGQALDPDESEAEEEVPQGGAMTTLEEAMAARTTTAAAAPTQSPQKPSATSASANPPPSSSSFETPPPVAKKPPAIRRMPNLVGERM